jgi:hypothetical protein
MTAARHRRSSVGLIASMLLLGSAYAEVRCPVEVKLLLASPDAHPVIAALGFEKATTGEVYFFDTDSLELLMQGVIVRVRQGAKNDLTVKLRPPKGGGDDRWYLGEQFPCEIDRTPAAAETSYAVGRTYNAPKAPTNGIGVYEQLSDLQKKLLHDAGISIDWARVSQVAKIHSTGWRTKTQSSYGKLALELWEWPAGKILELSSKVPAAADAAKYGELERLAKMKGLDLNASQDTKTTTVLLTFAKHAVPSR